MPRKSAISEITQLTIRITHEGFDDLNSVHEFIRSISETWFCSDHLKEEGMQPHTHYYITTYKTDQNVRVQLSKKSNQKGNKAYAISKLREELHHYYSYVMLKPESENQQHSGERMKIPWTKDHGSEPEYDLGRLWKLNFSEEYANQETYKDFEEVIKMACTYASTVQKKQEVSKAVNWMEEVLRDCYWDFQQTDEANFNTMYDYLVKRKYVNQFTEAKMRNIYYLWKAHNEKEGNQEAYKKQRAMFWSRM